MSEQNESPRRFKVRGPHGAVAVVRVGGPRGMSERTWKRRKASGELTVIEEQSAASKRAPKRSEKSE